MASFVAKEGSEFVAQIRDSDDLGFAVHQPVGRMSDEAVGEFFRAPLACQALDERRTVVT